MEPVKGQEEGIRLIGFLIRADGTVADSALSTCLFKPVRKDGAPVEAWIKTTYLWYFDDDPARQRQLRKAALAAIKGDAAAYFKLYLLLSTSAKTGADRERALIMLLNAAEGGYAHARFETGLVSAGKAQEWYEKAAAQGDLLARQRLKLGVLPR